MSETLAQIPMKRELDAGLTLLSEKYSFKVLPYDEDTVEEEKDCTPAPSATHAISWRKRILWLSEGDEHFEWLHEVAHLVCCPPWEDGPNGAHEFGGIFAWERAVGRELLRRAMWSSDDWRKLLHGQNIYATTRPTEFGGEEWCDWGEVRLGHQNLCLSYMYKTLRQANLLDKHNRPTFAQPVWSADVELRWDWRWQDVLHNRKC